jgi:hypothetical protein
VPQDARGKFLDGYINSLPDNFGSVADFTTKHNGAEKLTTLGPGMCGRDQPTAANIGGAGSQRPTPEMRAVTEDDGNPLTLVEQGTRNANRAKANIAAFDDAVGNMIAVANPLSREENEIGVWQPKNPVNGDWVSVSEQTEAAGNLFSAGTLAGGVVKLIRMMPNAARAASSARMSAVPESYMNLRHTVDMEPARSLFNTTTNSLGEVRNAPYFWSSLVSREPQMFSSGNLYRIQQLGSSPRVDPTWVQYNPTHKSFLGDVLDHHHINRGPIAVPLPRTVHRSWTSVLHGN